MVYTLFLVGHGDVPIGHPNDQFAETLISSDRHENTLVVIAMAVNWRAQIQIRKSHYRTFRVAIKWSCQFPSEDLHCMLNICLLLILEPTRASVSPIDRAGKIVRHFADLYCRRILLYKFTDIPKFRILSCNSVVQLKNFGSIQRP